MLRANLAVVEQTLIGGFDDGRRSGPALAAQTGDECGLQFGRAGHARGIRRFALFGQRRAADQHEIRLIAAGQFQGDGGRDAARTAGQQHRRIAAERQRRIFLFFKGSRARNAA